jgi:hypothetical protein
VDVERLLSAGGKYYLLIPDKRYSFDNRIAESNIAEIVGAHFEGRRVHTLASVIEHRALTTRNDRATHWGDRGAAPPLEEHARRILAAIAEWGGSKGGYLDVHAWQFTPASFRDTISILNAMRFINLEVEEMFETPPEGIEFTAILRRRTDPL